MGNGSDANLYKRIKFFIQYTVRNVSDIPTIGTVKLVTFFTVYMTKRLCMSSYIWKLSLIYAFTTDLFQNSVYMTKIFYPCISFSPLFLTFFVYFFGWLKCVGHSFAYVAVYDF